MSKRTSEVRDDEDENKGGFRDILSVRGVNAFVIVGYRTSHCTGGSFMVFYDNGRIPSVTYSDC